MNECKRVRELFLELCDDHIDPTSKEMCHEHMKGCPRCEEEFRWYGLTVQALADVEIMTPPSDFVAQLKTRLDGVHPSPSFMDILRRYIPSPPSLPLPVGVAALSLIVVVSFSLYNEAPTLVDARHSGQSSIARVDPTGRDGTTLTAKAGGTHSKRMAAGMSEQAASIPFTRTAANPSPLSQATAKSLTALSGPNESFFTPTLADRIGADNLTVESPSVGQAVESVKRMLPRLDGRLDQESAPSGLNEVILRVTIPTKAYADLTSELINHGAVEAGASGVTPPKRLKEEAENVVLHIRFLRSP